MVFLNLFHGLANIENSIFINISGRGFCQPQALLGSPISWGNQHLGITVAQGAQLHINLDFAVLEMENQ